MSQLRGPAFGLLAWARRGHRPSVPTFRRHDSTAGFAYCTVMFGWPCHQ
jgi:hypothetical protein